MENNSKEQEENGCKEQEDNTNKEQVVELSPSSSASVYEIPGEPAVVIDGILVVPPSNGSLVLSEAVNDAASLGNTRFGLWLVGREVRKLFGEQYYSGTVTEFDEESGWWRVVYEDGDLEDLEWNELEQVLQPLDIMVPLKSLALKTLKKMKKPVQKSKGATARPLKQKSKRSATSGKKVSVAEDVPMMTPEVKQAGEGAKQSAKKNK
ncbi:PREDICTED: dirigent protein 17-like [Fragaria vesca subsp. vesca]|uniref:dirigent protein 17-like n=1 Tax=Fragaria vesca subsp. vesca TaxID=101020 RepID=UPI0002C31E3E|nr:PREDICTED: dirigent protein 17-like [Fragaria vesca subsp. vesca]XP_004302819.1 PREDICTED: dirigent protein 17-like [Fragaria vesca subsp. vesca]XP_004302820.1 PREDICTED: dirigent protein 17-like [Fragaria vesca subsp. vesca]XP_004302821.1 PREDICTED: dirigent protein 17-like [Fragaria vesca subsp. vesca]